jgi:hypothetical protein
MEAHRCPHRRDPQRCGGLSCVSVRGTKPSSRLSSGGLAAPGLGVVVGVGQCPAAELLVPVPSSKHQVRAEFTYDGGGLGKGGTVWLYYDGNKIGEGRVETTQPFIFSADEGVDVGCEKGTTVAPECDVKSSTSTC